MSVKEFNQSTKEMAALFKKLNKEVPETSNASDFSKFLAKTRKEALTFDKDSDTYVDYVSKRMKTGDSTKKPKTPTTEETTPVKNKDKGDDKDTKKRKPLSTADEDESQKKKKKTVKK